MPHQPLSVNKSIKEKQQQLFQSLKDTRYDVQPNDVKYCCGTIYYKCCLSTMSLPGKFLFMCEGCENNMFNGGPKIEDFFNPCK